MEDNVISNDRGIEFEMQGSRPKIVIAESIVDSSDSSYGEILEEKVRCIIVLLNSHRVSCQVSCAH